MTYIDDARTTLNAELPTEDPELLDLYLLLTLVKGGAVTLTEVHDAWAIWRSRTRPDHQSIVPFWQLTEAVQALDKPYADAITAAASTQFQHRDAEFPATWQGGHALIVEFGDEELYGHCQCGTRLGTATPDKPIDAFAEAWERHVMGGGR